MTDQEKVWEEEANKSWESIWKKFHLNCDLVGAERFQKMSNKDHYKFGYLAGRRASEEEIEKLKNGLRSCGLAITHGGFCPYSKEAK